MTLAGQLASGGLKAEEVAVVELQPLEVWRVYTRSFGAAGFNSTGRGNARFSPLKDPDGEVVPTLYAGTTLEVALMETVLHDLPSPSVDVPTGRPGAGPAAVRHPVAARVTGDHRGR